MYQKGDYVVYGSKGVCEVSEIGPMDWGKAKDKMYYTLIPVYKLDSKIYTPVEQNKTEMRSIITKQEAVVLMDEFNEIEPLEIDNEKNLEQTYKDCLNSFNCKEMIRMVKAIHFRRIDRIRDGKKLIATDEKYLKIVKEIVIAELSIPLNRNRKDIEEELKDLL